jgi:hypothetical protein
MNARVDIFSPDYKKLCTLLFEAMHRESVEVLNAVYGKTANHPFIRGEFKLDREGKKVFEGSIITTEIVATCVL